MKNKIVISLFLFLTLFLIFEENSAQLVEVSADYNGDGDCIFSAHNNAKTPIFLHLDFADLQNTTFNETLPYIKQLDPGFNSLFTLYRDLDADVPRFNYQVKSYRSNPSTIVDLDFPYLIPFKPGTKVRSKEVKNIDGFWGEKALESWVAIGFYAKAGEEVFASRQGIVVEIAGQKKSEDPMSWYNTWNNSITLLQPDGTLICYHNVVSQNLELNQKVHAGELLAKVVSGTDNIVVLIYQNSLSSDDLRFIIPQFSVSESEIEIVNQAKEYTVVHASSVRALEMTKKEKRKILGLKK